MQNISNKEKNLLRLIEVEQIIRSCNFGYSIEEVDSETIYLQILIPFEYFGADYYSFSIKINMNRDNVYNEVVLALFGEQGKTEHLADFFRSLRFSMDYTSVKLPDSFVYIYSMSPEPKLFEEEVVEPIGNMIVSIVTHQFN